MNIDFDSLRDPEAPIPGTHHRAAVDARARRLRARARMNRLAVSSVSVVAVVALVSGIVASQRNNGPKVIVEGPSGTVGGSIANRFVPPTSTENGITTVPVTLPDGEATTLSYPQELQIAQLGFAGQIGVNWPVDTGDPHCCGRQVIITYDTIEHAYGNATPITVYRGANGEDVPYFHSPTNSALDYLVFQFGPWLVQVYDVAHTGDHEIRMTDDQRATWARSLTGTADDNGYLVLHAAAPLSIATGFDGGFGGGQGNHVELAAQYYCTGPSADTSAHRRFSNSDGTHGVAWCVGTDMHVTATGSQSFVDGADHGLQVSELTGPTATNTTTTEPVAPASPAVSASFVSPDHGWVLQRSGDIVETTDGGATWTRVGSLHANLAETHMRFADAQHGFVFDQRRLFATSDGGATWTHASFPVSQAFDFDVSRGTVYTVGFDDATSGFHIWSSPADHLSWTEDPLSIQPGAGPVASFQFVFSGDAGWLLYVDRVVISGARLTSTGRWGPWATPPCAGAGGGGYLAASTPNELVASCEEGVWTGPRVTHGIYFSHDGGVTFQRHDAPQSGPVATPNASIAIVAGGAGVQRTTDGGATWQGVFDAPFRARDLGFTTPTQGFVVFTNGEMLMTHDAGATWQKVTLP